MADSVDVRKEAQELIHHGKFWRTPALVLALENYLRDLLARDRRAMAERLDEEALRAIGRHEDDLQRGLAFAASVLEAAAKEVGNGSNSNTVQIP